MRFTSQQISEIVAFLDRYPNFDTEEEELPGVLVISQYAEEKYERQDVVFQAKKLMIDLVNEFSYVRADLDTSTDWIYIYITHN